MLWVYVETDLELVLLEAKNELIIIWRLPVGVRISKYFAVPGLGAVIIVVPIAHFYS